MASESHIDSRTENAEKQAKVVSMQRQVLDSLGAPVYTTDTEGRITYFNAAAAELWGIQPRLGVDRWCGFRRLRRPDGSPLSDEECPVAVCLDTDKAVCGQEILAEGSDGVNRRLLAYVTPLRDQGGKLVGAVNTLVDISEHKQTEAAANERAAQFEDFVRNATIGMYWFGSDGTILWANQAQLDMLGYSADEYIGRHITEVHAYREVVDDILTRLTNLETLDKNRTQLRCKDGSIKDVELDCSVYQRDGKFIHARCFTRDVSNETLTERRLAAAAEISQILSEAVSVDDAAPKLLKALSEHTNADIAELWLVNDKLHCAAFYSRLSGKALNDFRAETEKLTFGPGEGLPGLVWKSRRPVWFDTLEGAHAFARKRAASALGLNTGVCIPILVGARFIGVIACFLRESFPQDGVLKNLMISTGYKVGQFVERTREEQENRFLGAIVRASSDAIVSVDPDDLINSWNEGATRLFGHTPEEAIGQPVSLIIPEERAEERAKNLELLKNGKTVEPCESIRLNKAGDQIPVSISYSVVRNARGDIVTCTTIIRDISAWKVIEKQLEARVHQLESVSEFGISALAEQDTDALFNEAVARLMEGLEVEFAKILEFRPGSKDMLLRAGAGWKEGLVGNATVPADLGSQGGYALAVGRPVIVEDLNSEGRFSPPGLLMDHGVVSGLSVIIRGENGKPFGVLGAHSATRRKFTADDIHFLQSIANILTGALDHTAYENRQELLIRELSHRVKNVLSVVQAIARQTGHYAKNVGAFLNSFEGRISALAQAHDALMASNWKGGNLNALAQLVIGNNVDGERVELDLEDFEIGPADTQNIAMLFHELLTNALKHGALSNNAGKISVKGHIARTGDHMVYHLSWLENGGPPVKEPSDEGFGTRLIENAVKASGGNVFKKWDKEGLQCNVTIPLPGA